MSADTTSNKTQPTATPPKRSGKKMTQGESLNHLLNFSLPPRRSTAPQSIPRRSRKTANTYGVWNKEKFLNAQYRFVMMPSGDYTVHFADPDIYFQWQDILQVIIPRYSALEAAAGKHEGSEDGLITCPICLSTPSAPRMTKCGHVFCFPCVLHYLAVTDKSQCPICFDTISDKQLKCVKWFDASSTDSVSTSSSSSVLDEDTPKPGSLLRMLLMERQQVSTLALPRSKTWPSSLIPPLRAPFHFLPDVFRFAKFMLATPEYLLESLSCDIEELEAERRLLTAHGDELGVPFVDAAEVKVRRQMEKARSLETEQLTGSITRAKQDLADLERRHARRNLDTSSEFSPPITIPPSPPPAPNLPNRNQRQRRNVNPPPPTTSTYYYFQAASGAPIFLHPLDIRILLAKYHSYSAFPPEISVRVEAVGEGSIDDDLRRRCKYLAHFPESADVVFIEAELTDVVGAEHLQSFEGALRIRRTKRKEKERKDDRAKARAEEVERQKHYTRPAPDHRPEPSLPDFVNIVSPVGLPDDNSIIEVEPASAPTQQREGAGAWGQRSFASALHSPAPPPGQRNTRSGQGRSAAHATDEAADWELDAAWDDLEVGSRRGKARGKKGAKLVIMGGAGGRKR